jgi:nucleoside-diphosphate-sugar epimerase
MLLSRADIGSAARLLGYRPVFDLRSGLAQTIDWYIKNLAPAQQASLAHV